MEYFKMVALRAYLLTTRGYTMHYHTTVTLTDLIPCQEVPEKFPHLYSRKSWAWAVKQRHKNGLSKAFRKVGRKLFVNSKELARCINAQIELHRENIS